MPTAPGVAPAQVIPPGLAEERKLRSAGFNDTDVINWRSEQNDKLVSAGFTPGERAGYWGKAEGGTTIQSATEANLVKGGRLVRSPLEALAAGWDMSVTGLALNKKRPNTYLDQNADFKTKVAYALGQGGGDFPIALVGGVAGFFAGGGGGAAAAAPSGETAAPAAIPVGALLGSGFGSAAVPEAARQGMLLAYDRNEISTPAEFWKRTGQGALATVKAGTIGAVSNLIGGKVGGAVAGQVGGQVAGKFLGETADLGSQVGVAGTLQAASEGRMPTRDDFLVGGVIALGSFGGTKVAGSFRPTTAGRRVQSNLQDAYVRNAVTPDEIFEAAKVEPGIWDEVKQQDVNGDSVTPIIDKLKKAEPERAAHVNDSPIIDAEFAVKAAEDSNAKPKNPNAGRVAEESRPVVIRSNFTEDVWNYLEHKESRGNQGAVSPKGAYGVGQLMPATAVQVARELGDVSLAEKSVHDPNVNRMLGKYYLDKQFKRFQSPAVALAAYNAGPGQAAKWVEQFGNPGTDPVAQRAWAERITFSETKDYVQTIMRNVANNDFKASVGGRGSGGPPGGDGAAGGGGNGGGPRLPRTKWFDEEPDAAGNGDGGGGLVPPKPPGPPPGADGDPGFWSRQNSETLYEEMGRGIGEQPDRADSWKKLIDPGTLLTQVFSELEPVRQIDTALLNEGHGLDRNKDVMLEDMFRQTYASDQRAGAFVRYGAVDPITLEVRPNTPSIMDAVKAAREKGGNLEEWVRWMVAERANDKQKQGVETGFNPKVTEALAANQRERAKYEKATKIFNEVSTSALEFGRESGLFSDASVAAMIRDNPSYISFRRVMGDDEAFDVPGRGKGFKVGKTLKQMEGSDRQIVDPLMASIDNIRQIVKMADRNRALGAVVALAKNEVFKKDLGMEQLQFRPNETLSAKPGEAFKPYGVEQGETTYAPFLAERSKKAIGKNQFIYYNKGVPELWQVKSEALATLLRGADSPVQANVFMGVAQKFAEIQRSGITLAADFSSRMFAIDQFTAFVHDPAHPAPFLTPLKGVMSVLKQDKTFQDWVASGGAGSALAAMDADYVQRDIHKVFTETGAWDKIWNAVKHPLEFSQIISERLDAANRVGYYITQKEKGLSGPKAGTMSRKAYVDFAEKGTLGVAQQMAKIVPFFRPALLGLKQVGESVTGPTVMKGAGQAMNTALYTAGAVTLPIIALYVLNYLQDENDDSIPESRKFRNLPQWQKDTMFITPQIAGVRFKMGMPREAGIIAGGMVNRFLDFAVRKDKRAFDGWAKSFMNTFSPPVLPAVAKPIVEQMTDHSFFTGRPLIPASLEELTPDLQYTPANTEIAKGLSRALGSTQGIGAVDVSPIVLENYLRSWTGTLGFSALKALDAPFKTHGQPWEVADIPFVQGFVTRNPGMAAAPIQQFYETYADSREADKDVSVARKRGDRDLARELRQRPEARANLRPFAQAIKKQQAVLQAIEANQVMNRDEKRQAIENVYTQMIRTSKKGLVRMDKLTEKADADAKQQGVE